MANVLDKNFAWHFAPIIGGNDQGPQNAAFEYFKDMYESLVREAIQNSLDASDNSGNPVKVQFRFREIPTSNFQNFFTIKEHIKGCIAKYDTPDGHDRFDPMLDYLKRAEQEGKMAYLEVSDENTKGMTYKLDKEQNEESGRFYAFLKSTGVDDKEKGGTAGGAFGFGKSAFYKVSAFNTVLVSTKTLEDGKVYFEGASRLSTHVIDKQKYVDTGFFCMKDDVWEQPIESDIPARFARDKVGTTICVMGLDFAKIKKNKAIEQIKKAVLFNFWMAIQDKRLEVAINYKDDITLQSVEEVIKYDNLVEWMEKQYPEMEDAATVHNNPRPFFEAVRNCDKSKKCIVESATLDKLGDVRFYIFKNVKAPADRYIFMRKELMLISHKNYGSQRGFYGLFIVDGEKGNKALRPSEDATHREWLVKNCKTDEKKNAAKDALNEMTEYIDKIVNKYFSAGDGSRLDFVGANDYLYIPTADDDDDDVNDKAEQGNTDGSVKDDGNSPTTTVSKPNTDEVKHEGIAYTPVRTQASPSSNGDHKRGRGNGGHGGGESGPGNLNQNYKQDVKGKTGIYGASIPVLYNSWAVQENGVWYHVIVLHKKSLEIKNGRIVIMSVGEQKMERTKISSAWINGKEVNTLIDNHCIKGVNLTDSLRIKVKLNDDFKHSLSITAYEK